MIAALVPPGTLRSDTTIELPDAEAHHLRVRRVAPGTVVRLMDGQGGVAEAELLRADRSAEVHIRSMMTVPRPSMLRLVVGAGDRDRFEWLAEKCAELGVTDLVPMETALSASVATRLRPAHLERVQRRAFEAIKQSGSAWAPVVHELITVSGACAIPPDGARWLADPDGGDAVGTLGQGVTVLVGPEGGLTAEERADIVAAGFRPVRLGAHVLRFETAAIAAAVLVRARYSGGPDE